MATVGLTPHGTMVAENIRNFQGSASHNLRSSSRAFGILVKPVKRAHDFTDCAGCHARVKEPSYRAWRGRAGPG